MKATRQLHLWCAVLLFVMPVAAFAAEEQTRSARITDESGAMSDVTHVTFYGNHNTGNDARFRSASGTIVVMTDNFQIAVPVSTLVSIVAADEKSDQLKVTFQNSGKKRTLVGTLGPGTFQAESDFGQLTLSADKLKTLVFQDPPNESPTPENTSNAKEAVDYHATIVLANGTSAPVRALKRYDHYSYYSSAGYAFGGRTYYENNHYTTLAFKIGESEASLSFDKIKKIQFLPDKSIIVTLKTGKSATGTLIDANEKGLDGFTGYNDDGEFFIEPSLVKSVEFAEAEVSE